MRSSFRRLWFSGFLVAAASTLTYGLVQGDLSLLALGPALAIAALLALAAALYGRRRLAQSEATLREGVARFASGSLEDPLPPRRYGELRALARAIEDMRERLVARLEKAEGEEAQLRAVLADMVEGVVVLDLEGRILVVNQRLRELTGIWSEVVGRHHREVFRQTKLVDALRRALDSEDVFVTEISLGANDERLLQIHATGFARADTPLGLVAVFHDITELRRLERVRRDFVANVSHELKTPLTAIRGFAETLRAEEIPEEQRDRFLEVIERNARRLTRLIEDLMTLSRVEGGRETLEPEVLDLPRLVGSVLSDMRGQIEARKLEVHQEHDGDGFVFADRLAVEQVLVNLIDNALKYTDPGGCIEIRTRTEARGVRLTVADTGMGIPESEHDRIFERFYRVDAARGRDVGGTGLGLAIVRHVLQLSGGDIAVESEIGVGSTFIVTLPPPPSAGS
ncbi:MAG: PAS domain S-box protein [Myxococcales bacterium]|nr:PAS domain S-box protein [Myxococcales bacterium]